jgi:hypothetical protein
MRNWRQHIDARPKAARSASTAPKTLARPHAMARPAGLMPRCFLPNVRFAPAADIVAKVDFFDDERKFPEPLMRFARDDVRTISFHPKSITDLRGGDTFAVRQSQLIRKQKGHAGIAPHGLCETAPLGPPEIPSRGAWCAGGGACPGCDGITRSSDERTRSNRPARFKQRL